jgi:hypothetical protein
MILTVPAISRSQITALLAFCRARKISRFLPSVSVLKVATATADEKDFLSSF